jgi:SAM-dependent methyltransferase
VSTDVHQDAGSACADPSHTPGQRLYLGRDRLCGVAGEFEVVRCQSCALVLTEPRLNDEQLAAYYPSSYPAYRELPPAPTGWRSRLGGAIDAARFSATVRFGAFGPLLKRQPGRLLDVGCGRGDLAEWFAQRGWSVAGVEPGAQACALAGARGVEVHCGTLEDAPWPAGTFQAITFNHSLEHIPDPEAAVQQARELLAPGGMLIVSVPNFGCWQRRLFGSRWFHLDLPRHLQHFDRHSLPSMLRRNGLDPVNVSTSSTMVGLIGSVQYVLWGQSRLSDRAVFRLMHLTYPLVGLSDLFSQGDCLHVAAVRPSR